MSAHSPQQLSNNWILFNGKPPNNVKKFEIHTNQFIISFVKCKDNNHVYYESKNQLLCGESFKIILIMIFYELSFDELCKTIDFVKSFFITIIIFLRDQIDDLLKYQKHNKLVCHFFNEQGIYQYMLLPINKLNLVIHKRRISYIKKSFHKESSTIRKKLEEYDSFFKDLSLKIISVLSSSKTHMPSLPPIQKKMQLSIETQTPPQSPPQQPPLQKKMQLSIETQTPPQPPLQKKMQLSIETQTPSLQMTHKNIQTDERYSDLLKEIERLKKLLQKTSKQLEKEEDVIQISLEDHEKIVNDYRDIFNKDIKKISIQIETLKNLNRALIEKNKKMRDPTDVGLIFSQLPKEYMIGLLCELSISTIFDTHSKKTISDETRLFPCEFYEFWTECIIPKINESSPLILLQLMSEWERLIIFIRSSNMGLFIFPTKINIVFSQYVQDYTLQNYDNFVIPFFNRLIRSSKNIIILIGLVNIYSENKNDPVIKDRTYSYFIDLITTQNAEILLKKIIRSPNIESLNMNPKDRLEANTITFGIQLSA